MLFLLSPAKTLDYASPLPADSPQCSEPLFVKQSAQLIKILKAQSVQEVAQLMSLSDSLAQLNHQRFQAWSQKFTPQNSRAAVLAFNGDVYEGLGASSLKPRELLWAQEHIAILSGLYGVLRPLDSMQPYRLEMGTQLKNPKGSNLYDYWATVIPKYLNERLASDKSPIIVNLASQEYFKAANIKTLIPLVIECVFEQEKSGTFKVISFLAKRARGLMARYAIQNRISTVKALKDFDAEGYRYEANLSTPTKLVFRRRIE